MAGQVLVELVLEGQDTVTISGVGAEAADVKAWGVRQVDGEGLGQVGGCSETITFPVLMRPTLGQPCRIPTRGNPEFLSHLERKTRSWTQA